jgi:hypothetical protein
LKNFLLFFYFHYTRGKRRRGALLASSFDPSFDQASIQYQENNGLG